jgi:hypothetical protein
MYFSSSLSGSRHMKSEGLGMIKSGFPLTSRDIRLRNPFRYACETDVWYYAPMEDENICLPTFCASLHLRASPIAARGAQGGQR